MRIGDRIRFLNQTGGGIVVGFEKKGIVLVEDTDGFEIPVLEKECVVIEENTVGKKNIAAGESEADKQKVIQTRDGEKLNAALVYTLQKGEYQCILANECNYNLLVEYSFKYPDGLVTSFAGEVMPYERKTLFKFNKDTLNSLAKKVIFRAIPFKREPLLNHTFKGKNPSGDKKGATAIKPVIEKELTIDPLNLLKESLFKPNDYLSENGYTVPVINENLLEPQITDIAEYWSTADKNLKKELKSKFSNSAGISRSFATLKTANAVHKQHAEIIEVDLHATELLDTTAGMNSGDLLRYQLDTFNETMTIWLHKKGTQIVFIHGKGDGILRNAIMKELKLKYSRCKWQDASFKEYGYGATLVTIE